MDLKISVKTILLFAALFILGTMILGFYSCSGSTTPVTPQIVDDNGIVPDTSPIADAVSDDGVTTTTTPVTTLTDESGTIVYTYDLVIDESGSVTLVDPRNAQTSMAVRGDAFDRTLVFNGFDLEFSTFDENVPGKLDGTVTWTNTSTATLTHPRIAFWILADTVETDLPKFTNTTVGYNVDNPDIYCSAYTNLPSTDGNVTEGPEEIPHAFPCIFIADEDENYELTEGQSAAHPIVINKVSDVVTQVTLYIMVEVEPASTPGAPGGDDTGEGIPGWNTDPYPTNFAVSLVENGGEPTSDIEVVVTDTTHLWSGEVLLVEETASQSTTILTFDSYVGGDTTQPKFVGTILAQPSVDSPFHLLLQPRNDYERENYFWIESY